MLSEDKNIDQLFHNKLGDFERTPPVFVWTNIQNGLNEHRRVRRMVMVKTAGIAAALVLAFLAGWWMTNPVDKNFVGQNKDANQSILISKEAPKTNITQTNDAQLINRNEIASGQAVPSSSIKKNRTVSSNLSSLATFTPNTAILNNDAQSVTRKVDELELFDTEKVFLDHVHQNFKGVKKLADWIASVGKDTLHDTKSLSKVIASDNYNHNNSEGSVAIALNNPVRNGYGRWSLTAEIAPVFNNQPQSSTPQSGLFTADSPNYKPQKTIAENTMSGGLVAGYQVSKRLVVKSGVVYNNIRQSTSNVDFMGVNPLYNIPANASLAATPAGQVSLNKAVTARSEAMLDANSQLSYTAKYSAQNELKQDIKFIEIPVQAIYKLIDSKFILGLTGGISTNILVGNKAILSENGHQISSGETVNMRNVVYSGAVGIEVGYEVTNRITLTVEPRIKHFLSSLSTSKSIDYKPSQIGIVTGLTYSFN